MKTLIVDNGSEWFGQLVELIDGETTVVKTGDIHTVDPRSFDLIVLSGGSNIGSVMHNPLLTEEFDLVKDGTVPLIGVCYGAEVIAYSYGASLEKMDEKRQGISVLRLTDGKEIEVYEGHRFRIKNLPEEFVILGETDHAIEYFKHREKPLYGLQFHPEAFAEITEGRELFKTIIDECTK